MSEGGEVREGVHREGTYQEHNLDCPADEEDAKEQYSKVYKDIGTNDSDDLPQEEDGEHTINTHHSEEK